MAGVWRQELSSLQAGTQNSILIGIIIHSGNPKIFEPTNPRCKFANLITISSIVYQKVDKLSLLLHIYYRSALSIKIILFKTLTSKCSKNNFAI